MNHGFNFDNFIVGKYELPFTIYPWLCMIFCGCYQIIPNLAFNTLIRYATASARSDGLLLLCGGRDANSVVS